MPQANQLTDKQVGTYLVYRMKLAELMHLHFLFHHVYDGACGDTIDGIDSQLVLDTLRTCALSWFVTLFDPSGVNIFDLWEQMYPQYPWRLGVYRKAVEPNLQRLRTFRNKSAFHADRVFSKFFAPRVQMQEHRKQDAETLQRFLRLAIFLLKREHTVDPDLYSRILGVVFDMELALDCKMSRKWIIDNRIIDRSTIYGRRRF
jgi:hypothetical protein